jgi:hypothetical protein
MIKIGDYDIVSVMLQIEQRLATLEKAFIELNNKNGNLEGFKGITQAEWNAFNIKSGDELIAKYPSLGLKKLDK